MYLTAVDIVQIFSKEYVIITLDKISMNESFIKY